MKKIDLSFLKHNEIPTKKIMAEVNGEQVEIDILPITGRRTYKFRINGR